MVDQRTHNLEGVGNDADSQQLLAAVTAVHHERVGQTLNDGALGLAETLDGIATSGVREVDGRADLDVVAARVSICLPFPFPSPDVSIVQILHSDKLSFSNQMDIRHLSISKSKIPKRNIEGTYVKEMSRISTSS